MIVPPGAGDVRHSLPEKTVYFITGGKTKVTTEDGSVAEMELPDGATMWHEAWTHWVTNIGDTDTREIIVEINK